MLERGGEKFVTLDARRYAVTAVVRFDTKNMPVTANVDVTGESDLLRKRENELDRATGGGLCIREEKQTAIAYVARFAFFFDYAGAIWITQAHGKHHRKTTSGATLRIVSHGVLLPSQAITGFVACKAFS